MSRSSPGEVPAGRTDLVVVGGGPAGLATAIRARLAGLSVRVLERSRPPVDKACGEGLMPDAVRCLAELGVELPPRECCRIRGIRYLDGELAAEGLFPRDGGLGVRRLHLHRALARRAAELGVELDWGVMVFALAPPVADPPTARGPAGGPRLSGVVTSAGVIEARWVVGADGLRSRVRRWAGLEAPPARVRRFGVRRHFACRPWSDLVEVHWGRACEAYVTPVGPEEVGVAMLWGKGKATFDTLLASFPVLADCLAGAPASSRDRGAGPLLQRVRAVTRGNIALVGDASGYLDAITGEGLAVALHQSAALVDALAAPGGPDLRLYAAAHRRTARLPAIITALVLALERRPRLRRRAMSALAADPALFSRLLGIHARSLAPAQLGFDGTLRLIYRLVRA